MCDARRAHVKAGFVFCVGVQAVGFSIAEAISWSVGGCCGCGGCGSSGSTGVRSGGRGQWGQLWTGQEEEKYVTKWGLNESKWSVKIYS